MRYSALRVERRCDMAKKKKKEVPVLAVVEIENWKSDVLQFVLKLLGVPGEALVIVVEETGFISDGESYTHLKTGIKIDKKVVDKNE